MKTYRSARELQAEVDQVLARRPAPSAPSPLDEVAGILSRGRHYAWIGIYLIVGERAASGAKATTPVAKSTTPTVLPIRLGQHEFGALEVQGKSGQPLGGEDRVLLKGVAGQLAKYLHGPGRYLMRKAREAAAQQTASPQARGYQPESEKAPARTLAAAGESRR